jgi:hypothetical protein
VLTAQELCTLTDHALTQAASHPSVTPSPSGSPPSPANAPTQSLGDGLAVLLLRVLPSLAPPAGDAGDATGSPGVDAVLLSSVPHTLRGAEDDTREAAATASELLARLEAAKSTPGGGEAVRLLAAAAERMGEGVEEAEEALVNLCLLALLAPAVLGFKPSDGE